MTMIKRKHKKLCLDLVFNTFTYSERTFCKLSLFKCKQSTNEMGKFAHRHSVQYSMAWQLKMDRCGLSNEQREMNCYLTIVCLQAERVMKCMCIVYTIHCIHNSMENCQ